VACTGVDKEDPGYQADAGSSVKTGVVTSVDSTGFTDVKGFTLRSDGKEYDFRIDPDITYSFPPEHLHAHQATSEPVRVEYESRDGGFVATAIEDA
jgi:hypothetical protein